VLVGRRAELDALQRALDGAARGRGGLAMVLGEPGLGTSRLVRELTASAAARGDTVVFGRATASGAATSYRPWTEALLQVVRDRAPPEDDELRPAVGSWPAR